MGVPVLGRATGIRGVIREGEHKLIRWYDDDSVELYDLSKDLGEERNLASENPELAARLREKLNAWLKRSNAKMPTRVPN